MKRIFLFGLTVLLATIAINAQTKKATTQNEIDRLYEKYKGSDSITLYTAFGELRGKVSIIYNTKPASIIIKGDSQNKDAIVEFLYNTILMKQKQGYVIISPDDWSMYVYESGRRHAIESGFGWKFKEDRSSLNFLMKKGSYYFRINGGCCVERYSSGTVYTWEIETGDSRRQGGPNATTFDF
jgi:hypothetical protein